MSAAKNEKMDRDLVEMSMDKRFYSRYFVDTVLPADLAQHYIDNGWKQGWDPTPWFSSGQYINRHPELLSGSISPFVHYLSGSGSFLPIHDVSENDDINFIAAEFDTEFYVSQLAPEAGASLANPVFDYLRRGWKQGLNPVRWFSTQAYLAANPDVANAGVNPFLHYLRFGRQEARLLSAVAVPDGAALLRREFNSAQYREQLARAGISAGEDLAQHYMDEGWKLGLDPVDWFSTSGYLAASPDVEAANINPFLHYLCNGREEGRQPKGLPAARTNEEPLVLSDVDVDLTDGAFDDSRDGEDFAVQIVQSEFDMTHYASQLDEKDRKKIGNLVLHYLRKGWKLGLDPTAWFSTRAYLDSNEDVARSGVNPFLHFLSNGRLEGRSPGKQATVSELHVRAAIADEFNKAFYLSIYPDIVAAGVDPLEHYLAQGWQEGRDPNPFFSTQHYVDANPDVINAGMNPFFHYVIAGKAEGRTPRHALGFRYDILRQLKPVEEQLRFMKAHAGRKAAATAEELRHVLTAFFEDNSDFILSFSHDDFTANIGGVQLMLRREMKALAEDGFAHINLFPTVALPFIEPYDTNPVLGLLLNGQLAGYFASEDLVAVFAEFAGHAKRNARSSFVIHNLLGHNLKSVVAILNSVGFKEGYYWLHDYTALYNKWNLMRNDVQYGGPPKKGSRAYELCIFAQADFDHATECARLFDNFAVHLISPSQSALDIWVESDLQKTASTTVLPHCELVAADETGVSDKTPGHDRLRIGYVGFPAHHKGWPVFRDLVLEFAHDDRYEFYYLGGGCPAGLPIKYYEVSASEADPYAMRDAIAESELDIVFAWSLCPETFSLVAYEAIAGGALLLANPDGGNIPAIINKEDCGLVIEDEASLPELMKAGAFVHMARQNRDVTMHNLSFSRMLADVLKGNG